MNNDKDISRDVLGRFARKKKTAPLPASESPPLSSASQQPLVPSISRLRALAAEAGISVKGMSDDDVYLMVPFKLAQMRQGVSEQDMKKTFDSEDGSPSHANLAKNLCESGYSASQAAVIAVSL